MRTPKNKPTLLISACLMTSLLMVSCAEIRLLTYPADFTWIGQEHLKTAMHEMANSVSMINNTLAVDSDSEAQQEIILQELDAIENYATSLSGETEWTISDRSRMRSNHTLLTDNLERFIEIVSVAKIQAQATPANYYGVGKITGGCLACHNLK